MHLPTSSGETGFRMPPGHSAVSLYRGSRGLLGHLTQVRTQGHPRRETAERWHLEARMVLWAVLRPVPAWP